MKSEMIFAVIISKISIRKQFRTVAIFIFSLSSFLAQIILISREVLQDQSTHHHQAQRANTGGWSGVDHQNILHPEIKITLKFIMIT